MQRHRHKGIGREICKSRVSESLAEDFPHRPGEPGFAAVFEPVDEVPDGCAAAHDADGTLEVERRAPAVRANDSFRHSIERLGANAAAGLADALDRSGAIAAKILSFRNPPSALRAVRRVEQAQERLKQDSGGTWHGA
jgi:hypothetical protein